MQMQPAQTELSASSSSEDRPALVAVPPAHLRQLWPVLAPLFMQVLSRPGSGWTMEAMVEAIASEQWQLWMVWSDGVKALCATELQTREDATKVCRILWCVGEDAKAFVPILRPIERWARSEGCTGMVAVTRKGWAKHLPDYKMSHVILEKAL